MTNCRDWIRDSYVVEGVGNGDCRKLVTLQDGNGMIWVGIRSWTGSGWTNNGASQPEKVLAWQDLPAPAYSDGLMNSAPAPTLGDHWTT
jgi:hypothetical protein